MGFVRIIGTKVDRLFEIEDMAKMRRETVHVQKLVTHPAQPEIEEVKRKLMPQVE